MQVTLVDGQPKVTLSQKEKRTLRDAQALCKALAGQFAPCNAASLALLEVRTKYDPEAPTTPPNASEPQADKDTK